MKYYLYKKITVVLVIVSLVLLFGVGYAVVGPLAIPVSNYPETHFESKPVPEGQAITHDFVVRNNGKALLTIDKVKTT